MKKRVKGKLYFLENYKYIKGEFRRVTSNDGTLLSINYGRTKLYASELPEWFFYGRYYKRFGYLSTKGITALKYIPNKYSNHFLKDDRLMISYGKTEDELVDDKQYDIWVWGNEILDILQGAKVYSGYDIEPIVAQIKDKEEWVRNKYPDEFGEEKWRFNLEERMQRELYNGLPPKYYAVNIKPFTNASFIVKMYASETMLKKLIENLPSDYSQEKEALSLQTAEAVSEVMFLKDNFGYIEGTELQCTDSTGEIHDLKYNSGLITEVILKENEKFVLCATANVFEFMSRNVGEAEWTKINQLKQDQVVVGISGNRTELTPRALVAVNIYDTAVEAVAALGNVKEIISAILKFIFEVRADAK